MGLLSKADGKKSSIVPKAERPVSRHGLECILEQYFKTNSCAGGIVVNSTKEEVKKIPPMVSHFALAEELPSGRCMILFSESFDQDLIAHRLKENLGAEIPLVFKAGSAAEALQKIQPYR